MVERIKRILGLSLEDDTLSNDFLLEQFIEMYSNALMIEVNETSVPDQLDFVLIEAIVTRWNRRGSEGLKSESVDVVSQTFHDDIFASNRFLIESYKTNKKLSNPKKGFRML